MIMNDLLIEATKKLIDISKIPAWKNEILLKAPPVVWFGDINSSKKKILTFGANPSREEFLKDNKNEAKEKIKKGLPLKYLENKRFYQLSTHENYRDIIYDTKLQNKIIESYNEYFKTGNSYKWFGKEKSGNSLSYNVEGFLNSLNCSYFDNNNTFQGIHIDLFPFPTISNFKEITSIFERDIEKWAKIFIDKLIKRIQPEYIFIFGLTNFNHFKNLYQINVGGQLPFEYKKNNGNFCRANYWLIKSNSLKIIGLSTNLGNPKGFTKVCLSEFGKAILSSNHSFTKTNLSW